MTFFSYLAVSSAQRLHVRVSGIGPGHVPKDKFLIELRERPAPLPTDQRPKPGRIEFGGKKSERKAGQLDAGSYFRDGFCVGEAYLTPDTDKGKFVLTVWLERKDGPTIEALGELGKFISASITAKRGFVTVYNNEDSVSFKLDGDWLPASFDNHTLLSNKVPKVVGHVADAPKAVAEVVKSKPVVASAPAPRVATPAKEVPPTALGRAFQMVILDVAGDELSPLEQMRVGDGRPVADEDEPLDSCGRTYSEALLELDQYR